MLSPVSLTDLERTLDYVPILCGCYNDPPPGKNIYISNDYLQVNPIYNPFRLMMFGQELTDFKAFCGSFRIEFDNGNIECGGRQNIIDVLVRHMLKTDKLEPVCFQIPDDKTGGYVEHYIHWKRWIQSVNTWVNIKKKYEEEKLQARIRGDIFIPELKVSLALETHLYHDFIQTIKFVRGIF